MNPSKRGEEPGEEQWQRVYALTVVDEQKIHMVHEFIGRTDAEVEVPILWPHDTKS